MNKYNIEEIINFAIAIEKKGSKFYSDFADKFDDEEIKSVFLFLSEEENTHYEYFSNFLSLFEDISLDTRDVEDYYEYLSAFVDNAVFNRASLDIEYDSIKSVKDALRFAMNRELDSVNFYLSLKDTVKVEHQNKILHIIEEEKKHFMKLHGLLEKYSNA